MSSSATPHGARPTGTIVGSPYQGKVTHYKIKNAFGTSIFFGDFVKWGDDNPNTTIQKDTGTTACTPIGVFLGCAYTDPTTGQFTTNQYYPALNPLPLKSPYHRLKSRCLSFLLF